jgi:non-ribosomal peptide synthetase component F
MVGFFVNGVVLRIEVGGRPTIAEQVARVRTTLLEAYDHQEYPYQQLVRRLNPVRSASRMPLVPVMFTYFESKGPKLDASSWLERVDLVAQESVKFDYFSVNVETRGDALDVHFIYAADLFHEAAITGLSRDLVSLLTFMLTGPVERSMDEWASEVENEFGARRVAGAAREARFKRLRQPRASA